MMWNVVDYIVGEQVSFKNYMDALEEAERRITMHEKEFPYRHRGYHYATPCKMIENKSTKTITIQRKD